MKFKKYQHVCRFGTSEVEGIEKGECYIFPKIDGTNASLFWDGEKICAGSRNRELSLDNDNAGFMNAINNDTRFINFFKDYPNYRLFGEWLVKHTIKDYKDDAWRKFYVFDVLVDTGLIETAIENGEKVDKPIEGYLEYSEYSQLLDSYKIDYIPVLDILINPTREMLLSCLEKNTYLMKDNQPGEGIVIKNYYYMNKWGNIVWAKIVRAEFLNKANRKVWTPKEAVARGDLEIKIAEKYITKSFIEKEKAKIINNNDGIWSSKFIGKLIGLIWKTFLEEEITNILKEYRNPTINFKDLNVLVIERIKELAQDIFC